MKRAERGPGDSDCDNTVNGSTEVIDNLVELVKCACTDERRPLAIARSVYRGIGSLSKDWRRIGDVPGDDPSLLL
jgi:hypothetical protein